MNNDQMVDKIRAELQRRRVKNPSYSLRSFARDLDVDPSNLSKILARKKSPGKYLALKIGEGIGFAPGDQDWIFRSLPELLEGTPAPQEVEKFKIISGWQHAAILELAKVSGFKMTAENIADRLGLTRAVVEESLQRLETVGFVLRSETGVFKVKSEGTPKDLHLASSEPYLEQQREVLKGALQALERVPIEMRSQTSMTFAIDSKRLDEAKLLIKKFRRQMATLLAEGGALDEVYQLSVSLYPVTTPRRAESASSVGKTGEFSAGERNHFVERGRS